MNIYLLITLITGGIVLVIQTVPPLFFPTKWVYFHSFRPKEQQEHEEMIKNIKDYIERRRIFNEKVAKLKQEQHD